MEQTNKKDMIMSSVSELVKQKTKENDEALMNHQKNEEARKKREISKKFSKEVQDIINRFEHRVFDINASKSKVAEFIVDHTPIRSSNTFGTCSLSWSHENFESIKFKKDDRVGYTNITRSPKFNRWKKALEDKFKIDIWVYRDYEYKERFGNSGFATYPDEIYLGIRANVYLKKK